MKKLSLELDALAVESFATTPGMEEDPGTVRAHDADTAAAAQAAAPACTCAHSCLCETNYYYCGTGPHTIYSCDYTFNRSCAYGAE